MLKHFTDTLAQLTQQAVLTGSHFNAPDFSEMAKETDRLEKELIDMYEQATEQIALQAICDELNEIEEPRIKRSFPVSDGYKL